MHVVLLHITSRVTKVRLETKQFTFLNVSFLWTNALGTDHRCVVYCLSA